MGSFDGLIAGQRETAEGSAAPACAESEGEEKGVGTLESNPEELMVHAWMNKESLWNTKGRVSRAFKSCIRGCRR